MSRKRQDATRPEEEILVRSLALRLPDGFRIDSHEHAWAQMIYATRGVMSVFAAAGSWVVPSRRALWMPAGFSHRVEMSGSVAMRTLYFRPDATTGLPRRCRVLGVSPLLRELVLEILRIGHLYSTQPSHARLAAVLFDQLRGTPEVALDLRLPEDPRALRLARRVFADPGSPCGLSALARDIGASPRTLERLFQKELGTTFGRWRKRVRLHHALRLLARGSSVTTAAREVGYGSTSAFIATFKRALGKTPRRYYLDGPPAGIRYDK